MNEIILSIYNDPIIRELIGTNIYPNYTTYLGDCIVFDFHTYYNDRKIKKMRLRLTLITQTKATGDILEDRIAYLINTLGDCDDGKEILDVRLSGGGSLYDDNRHKNHRILYYDCLVRGIGGI